MGGQGRQSVDDATRWIDEAVEPLDAGRVPVSRVFGRVLAEDLRAHHTVPPVDRAAIDGVALRATETAGAGAYNPLSFRLLDAGGSVPPGAGVLVNAGDRLPRRLDAVAPLEIVEQHGGRCELIDVVPPGHGIERAGSGAASGDVLARAGRYLLAHDIAVLGAAGVTEVPVVRRPRVGMVLVEPTNLPSGVSSGENGALLAALIERDGATLAATRLVGRERAAIAAAIRATEADLVLVAGGTGPGRNDRAAAALDEAGALVTHGVALTPGETAGFGRTAAGAPVFLLPGGPAGCLWAYEFLAGRAVRRLGGRDPAPPYRTRRLVAGRKLVSTIGRTEILPVRLGPDDRVEPVVSFAEAGIAAAARADGFVAIAEGSEGVAAGAEILVYLYTGDGDTCAAPVAARRPP